jgi:Tfp pilus assembly protein PilN
MFTIDLLKGQGRPARTKPQGVALFVATFTVPMLVAFIMVGYYARNSIVVTVLKQKVNGLDMQIQRLKDALTLKESFEKEKTAVNNCLADVAASIHKHTQWSPVLISLVENLPDSVILNSLEVKRSSVKRRTPATGDSKKKLAESNVTVNTLKMRVSGNPSTNCDLEVKAFRERLKNSKELGPKLEDVIIAAQGHDILDDRDVIAYDIDCIFKSDF